MLPNTKFGLSLGAFDQILKNPHHSSYLFLVVFFFFFFWIGGVWLFEVNTALDPFPKWNGFCLPYGRLRLTGPTKYTIPFRCQVGWSYSMHQWWPPPPSSDSHSQFRKYPCRFFGRQQMKPLFNDFSSTSLVIPFNQFPKRSSYFRPWRLCWVLAHPRQTSLSDERCARQFFDMLQLSVRREACYTTLVSGKQRKIILYRYAAPINPCRRWSFEDHLLHPWFPLIWIKWSSLAAMNIANWSGTRNRMVKLNFTLIGSPQDIPKMHFKALVLLKTSCET